MYHRIAEPLTDPWDLSVSPSNFAAQLDVLHHLGIAQTLSAMTKALCRKSAPRRSFAITFDDGYRDNLVAGLPVLKATGAHATVFVSSGLTGGETRFWWDTLVHIFLESTQLPQQLDMVLGGHRRSWKIGTTSGPARRRMLRMVWQELVRLEPAEVMLAIQKLADWAGVGLSAETKDRAMNRDELRQLAASGQIEIGGHSLTHAALPLVSPATAIREIEVGRAKLRDWTGQDVDSFAYPFGMYNKTVVGLVRGAGFKRSSTVTPGVATPSTDPFRIPRIHVKNWSAEVFENQIASFVGR